MCTRNRSVCRLSRSAHWLKPNVFELAGKRERRWRGIERQRIRQTTGEPVDVCVLESQLLISQQLLQQTYMTNFFSLFYNYTKLDLDTEYVSFILLTLNITRRLAKCWNWASNSMPFISVVHIKMWWITITIHWFFFCIFMCEWGNICYHHSIMIFSFLTEVLNLYTLYSGYCFCYFIK